MTEVNLIIHILASLPEEYEVAVSFLEDWLMNLSAQALLGIETVQEKIILQYDCLKKHDEDESDEKAHFVFKK